MKSLLCLSLVVFSFSANSVAFSADAPPAAGETARPVVAGKYIGTWSSGDESGKLIVTLKPDGDGWAAESSFTFQAEEIQAKVVSVKVDGTKFDLVLDWVIQGGAGQSHLIGEIGAKGIDGTYDTKTADNTSSGIWTLTRT